jgi:hypothetical protein
MRYSDGGGIPHDKSEKPGRRRLGQVNAGTEVSQQNEVFETKIDRG